MSESWDIGDLVRLSVLVKDEAGTASDATVTLHLRAPDGTPSVVTAGHDGEGAYHADILPNQSGVWRYRWSSTGAVTTTEEGSFSVRHRRVP